MFRKLLFTEHIYLSLKRVNWNKVSMHNISIIVSKVRNNRRIRTKKYRYVTTLDIRHNI